MSCQQGGRGPALQPDTVQVPALVPHKDPVSGQAEHRTARLADQVLLTEETEGGKQQITFQDI